MYFTDDGRSECGYVGLTNLGATCYMATCVQQLYMIPDLRDGILTSSVGDGGKHPMTLQELQRMFAYLRDSERKAYNPLSFCKTYEMDHQPLNTGEQKDMAEFFIGKTKISFIKFLIVYFEIVEKWKDLYLEFLVSFFFRFSVQW